MTIRIGRLDVRSVAAGLIVAVASILGAATLHAHDQTFMGTVIAVKGQTIDVQVIDEKTKKTSPMAFEVTSRTKVFRGDREVPFAEARIQKAERIVVTVNHDVSPTRATVVRLAATSGPAGD